MFLKYYIQKLCIIHHLHRVYNKKDEKSSLDILCINITVGWNYKIWNVVYKASGYSTKFIYSVYSTYYDFLNKYTTVFVWQKTGKPGLDRAMSNNIYQTKNIPLHSRW